MSEQQVKRITTFLFYEGALSVKQSGHGVQDGWAELVFDERQLEFKPHETGSGSDAVIEIAPSELKELRDFLSRSFPDGAGVARDGELVKALESAVGYLLNAKIDLETGCPKATAIKTIEGGLNMVRAALAKATGGAS